MAHHQRAVVLHAAVALDRAHRHPAGEAHHRHHEAGERGLPELEGRRRPPEHGCEQGGARGAAKQAFPGAVGTHRRGHQPLAEHPAPDILHAVGKLHEQDQKEEQAEVAGAVGVGRPLDRDLEEGRGEREAVDADHQTRLDLGRPLQEPLVVAGECDSREHEQRGVDRQEHAEDVVAVEPHEHVVEGREQEEHPEQGAVVALAGGRERDELAERPERHEPEEDDRGRRAEPEGRGEHRAEDPPATEPVVERADRGGIEAAVGMPLEELAHGRGRGEQGEHAGDERDGAVVVHAGVIPSGPARRGGHGRGSRVWPRPVPATSADRS